LAGLFDGASAGTLRRLAEAFRTGRLGAGASRFSVFSVTPCPETVTDDVLRLVGEGMSESHLVLLLESAADCVEIRGSHVRAELVWSGPEVAGPRSRDTSVVLQALFSQAKDEVLLSTFVVHQPAVVFRGLADRIAERPALNARVFLHIGRGLRDTVIDGELVREFGDHLGREWPGPRRPEVYYDPRGLSVGGSIRATWHAKCVVIDRQVAFVTSANFTERAQTRNVEAGVLISSPEFAQQLAAQFDALVQARLVTRLPGF
jgi:phosphatidylserine/phosphatidylglycerophosphate/cardiolipin synthase-like enzyme